MNALVNIERGLLREAFQTHVALEGTFARVNAHVDIEVGLPAERGVALRTLERLVHAPITWNNERRANRKQRPVNY